MKEYFSVISARNNLLQYYFTVLAMIINSNSKKSNYKKLRYFTP